MIELISLISGSSGNSSVITDGKTTLLLDCGTSAKRLEESLANADILPKNISALLITHEHSDHIKGAGVAVRRYNLPIYATAPTHKAMDIGKINDDLRMEITPEKSFEIDSIGVTPFSIPHDAAMPVGFVFSSGDESVAVATDIGRMNENILNHLHGCKKVLLESNHDVDMLRVGPYPYPLKQRILSDFGHLSNASAAEAALDLANHGTKQLMLGHLSVHNNYPETAIMETYNRLTSAGVEVGREITLQVADRYKITKFYSL